jgi:monoterpene epsilon-lactone hydrolase
MQQHRVKTALVIWISTSLMALIPAFAQEQGVSPQPQADTAVIESNGTAHITRVVPIPDTVSSEAKKSIARLGLSTNAAGSLPTAQRRAMVEGFMAKVAQDFRNLYPVNIENESISGVRVRVVTPLTIPENRRDCVLINLHAGGSVDASSLTESIPIANLTKTKVVAVLYPLLPEHPFPAAVDGVVSVYRQLLKTYKPRNIGLYGSSAGAVLSAEAAVKLRKLGLPLPGALGFFSGTGDLGRHGDSEAFFSVTGLSGLLTPPTTPPDHRATNTEYAGSADPTDPVLSPIFADLSGFSPTLFVTSTRDIFLSGTALLHRAFLREGVDARLVVFEGLSHTFWVSNPNLPETKEALELMAAFFTKQVGGSDPEGPTKDPGR